MWCDTTSDTTQAAHPKATVSPHSDPVTRWLIEIDPSFTIAVPLGLRLSSSPPERATKTPNVKSKGPPPEGRSFALGRADRILRHGPVAIGA